jgi:hypothetical protein
MWKKVLPLMMGVIALILTANSLFAQQKNYDNLQGKKWMGTREVSVPTPGFVKTTVEITKSIDGKIEGFYQDEAQGKKPSSFKFNSTVEENPNGLPRFKFKYSSDPVDVQCDVEANGKLSVQMFAPGFNFRAQLLDPVKNEPSTNVSRPTIPEPAPKKEQGKVKIENGVISFPEQSLQGVIINLSQLKFSFPSDTPKEIMGIKGKLFKSDNSPDYVIPVSYNSSTREIDLYCLWEQSSANGKPLQYHRRGTFNPEETLLRPEGGIGFILKFEKNGKFTLTTDNQLKFVRYLSPIAEIPVLAATSSVAVEQKGVKIENGIISFPDQVLQGVTIKLSQLKVNFPPDSPKEILATKGKVFKSDSSSDYVIPESYNSDTKEIILHCIWEKSMSGKPLQLKLAGLFDPKGSSLKPIPPGPITWRLDFLKNGKLRLRSSGGVDFDSTAVAEIPVSMPVPKSEPAPRKEPEKAKPAAIPSDGKVQSRDDIISAFSGKTVFFERWQDNDNGVEIKIGRDGFAEAQGKKFAWTVDESGVFCTSKKEWEDEGKRDVFYGCKTIMRLEDGSLYGKGGSPSRSGKISIASGTPSSIRTEVVTGSSNVSAQNVKGKAGWVIGKWRGFEDRSKSSWALEVIEQQDGKLIGSFMWIDEKDKSKKMYPISINLNGDTLTFKNYAKEDFVLDRASDYNYRMDGKYTDIKGKEREVRFWKEGGVNTNPLLGVWEGFWANGLKVKYTIEYIDNTAATIRSENGSLINERETIKEGWGWENASVLPSGELKVGTNNKYFIYKLTKNKNNLDGELFISGSKANSISLSKADPTPPLSVADVSLSESISAFLGTWEGFWGMGVTSQLVIEKINPKEANCVYSWAGVSGAKDGSSRVTAKVDEKKATIEWGGTIKFIFTMGKDLKSIEGRREAPGDISTITMKRKK